MPKRDGSSERRISLTLSDARFEAELDLDRNLNVEEIIDTMKGRSVILTLTPSNGDAFIANKPEISAIARPTHPIQ
ncbi:hypothetical protein ABTE42_21155, partial [Acinetobacter baumannii]